MMSNQPGSGVSYSAIDSDSRLDNPSVTEKAPFSQHQGEVSVKTFIGTNSQCDGDIDLTVPSSNKSDNCTMNTSSPSKSLTSVDTSILSPPHHWNGTHPATHFKSKSPKSHSVNTLSMDLTVPMFFSHKVIFITGATGFIGKVLIEKLLRSCPDLECVYCLIRPKNKQTIQDRLDEITNSKLFDRLRKEQPNFASKLKPIGGDMVLPELGISESERQMLEQSVHVVFHSAATVRFDEPLRVAVEMNVIAVQKMVKLCKKFEHLMAFVHVSTAYANCDRPYIEEQVYPPPVEPQKIIDVLEWMDDDMLELFTPKLMGDKPNTYTYTKQLAEHVLITEGAGLPLAIIRPSIVGAAWKEPFPGWIDNYNGPSGIYIAAGRGILRSMKGESSAIADIVPVDIPVNIMITVAWYTAVARPKTVLVYHATTGGSNPFTWGDMSGIVNKSFKDTPLEGCFRRPNVQIVSNSFLHDYWTCVSHLFPAYICDIAFRLMGKKPRMVKLYNRLHRSIESLKFFTSNEWQWANSNHDMLKHQLCPADLKTFYFDPLPLHWPTYIENYCLGAKKYVLNEDISGLPAARAHIRKLRIIRYVFNSTVAVILWRVLIAKSQFARNLWFFIVGLVFKFVQYFRITSTMQKS
ncbi:fatty acyl-CoA reductase 1-like [Biomphalaria glabrata]|uniref:Fatty acyl-CoA reductase n=1 Tax=Biomphalaria glabrata TaxID=6526 RepID=A0A9W3BK75_BIOGL|nr:fatty acyl-CoA reductase 1-like [Biomphalaria glabrata]